MATANTTASGAAQPRGRASIALLVSLALTAVVTVVLAAFAIYVYQSEQAQRWSELRRGLAASADELAGAVSLPVWNFDEAQIVTIMKSALGNRRLQAAMVKPAGGANPYIVLRNADGLLAASPVAPQEAGLLAERRHLVVDGQRIGSIALYASPASLDGELRQRALGIAGMIVLLDMALVAGLYAVLWRTVLEPVRAIGQYAHEVEAGRQPCAPAPHAWVPAELDQLSGAIRHMVAQQELRRMALLESEQRLRIATRVAGIGVWDWDIRSGTFSWDDQMFRLYGERREDVADHFQFWLQALHPEDAGRAQAALQRVLDSRSEMAEQFRIVWRDGSVHHIRSDASLFRDGAGKPVRMVGVNYDITAHTRADDGQRRPRPRQDALKPDAADAAPPGQAAPEGAARARV